MISKTVFYNKQLSCTKKIEDFGVSTFQLPSLWQLIDAEDVEQSYSFLKPMNEKGLDTYSI